MNRFCRFCRKSYSPPRSSSDSGVSGCKRFACVKLPNMTKKEIKTMQKIMAVFFDRVIARGGELTAYTCPYCQEDVTSVKPNEAMVSKKGYWDSAKTCIKCGEVSFVKVWPNGKTEADRL